MAGIPTAIIVCERDGAVRSASPSAATLLGGAMPSPGAPVAESLADPGLSAWVGAAFRRVSEGGDGETATVKTERGDLIDATVTPTSADGSGLLAVLLAPAAGAEVSPAAVSRKTWHDIQNQLGGLKLYATFLKRKLGTADEQVRETIEKIVMGIDAVARSISDARRGGEEGSRNEKGQSNSGH